MTLCSAIGNSSSTTSNSVYLPKGIYDYSFSISGGGQFTYNVSCIATDEFIYLKYDSLNRIVEKGEYQKNDTSDFTQSNADSPSFPTSNTLIWKEYGYDTASPDANASGGQTNLFGKLSYTEFYRYGSRRNLLSYSYDDMGRVAWKLNEYSWHPKWIYYWYDLQGDVTQKLYEDLDPDNLNGFVSNYTYNQAGRLSNVTTDASSTTQEANYSYFASGKDSQLKLGPSPLATVKYHYNQRGWLTSDSSTDFWEHLAYNDTSVIGSILYGPKPQYNGNISWDSFYMKGLDITDPVTGNPNTNTFAYAYGYDHANRLTGASFLYGRSAQAWDWSGANDVVPTYYSDGNLRNLQRMGSVDTLVDNLNYNYRSKTDLDTTITNVAFPGATGAKLSYDFDGNIQSDSRDDIGFVVYDPENQPVKQWMTNGTVIQYGYDVSGNRVEKIVNSTYTLYFRGKGERTQAINLEPYSQNVVYNIWAGNDDIGQVDYTQNVGYSYYYYLKDHLGNIRMTLNSGGGIDAYNNYYPFGEQLPGLNGTGSSDGRYKFTSKELDPTTSLYYFGARYYSAWAGRWMSVDPLAKKYPGWSPYNYSLDNPVAIFDPNGAGPLQALEGFAAGFGQGALGLLESPWSTLKFAAAYSNHPYTTSIIAGEAMVNNAKATFNALAHGNDFTRSNAIGRITLGVAAAVLTGGAGGAETGIDETAATTDLALPEDQTAPEAGNVTYEIKARTEPGGDNALSRHILEKVDGKTNSVTHQVEKDGELIHQHQTHIGKYGAQRRFPDNWIQYKTIPKE